ncbi:hypothetical protein [Liberiplasma polymorphum]|uniref:hypothetical protein n=1 Tax=Liberiplasma polymorphum TaxID=3374570 RepID=UPI0037743ADC
MRQRIVTTMPLIVLFLLLFSGFVVDNWRLGASFILLIPLSWILLSHDYARRIHQAMPLIALAIFLWLGFGFNAFHPGWVVFFLIPLSDMIFNGKIDARKMVTVSVTIIYVAIGIMYPRAWFPESLQLIGESFWHPGWIIFFLIPIINNLFFPNKNTFINMNKMQWKDKMRSFVKNDDEDFDF